MSVIIRLQNLPLTANASDVRNFFQGLAIPDGGVHIVGGELGDAFIAFSTDEDARQAMSLNGRQMKGVTISLLLSSRAEMQKVIEQARKAALAYMQLSRVVPTPVATPPKAQPNFKAMAANPISAVAAAALSSLSATLTHGVPAAAAQHQQSKPQPPVISLAGFLGQSAPRTVAQTNELIAPPATGSAVVSPLLTQSSLYQEIPGLSFLSSGPASTSGPVTVANSAANSSGIAGWLSAMHEYRGHQQQQPTLAAGVAKTELPWNTAGAFPGSGLVATGINTTPLLSSDRNGYATGTGESQWKMLNKPRRSRSPSGEPRRDQQRRSRSSSRDRDRRSSSRDRAFKRDGHSRSSSRDRRSRSSSREYSRRFRNSRSRSSSRDRFGRGRHQRSHSRSRDRNDSREPTNAYGDRTEPGRSTRVRASRFSDRYGDSRSPNQWSSMEQGFTGNAATQPMYGVGVPNQQSEPIFGLHTSTAMDQQRSRFQAQPGVFPARSGKISPPMPVYNGVAFRSTSPLPDSVYQSVKSPTSDFAVRITNLETSIGYGDIRRFFKQQPISTQGIKMINDLHGRRTGMAYLQFMRKEGKLAALQRDKAILRRAPLHIESITDQEFEQATDSYRPSGNDKPSQKWDDQRGGSGESFRRSRFGGRGNDNGDVIEIDDDQDDQQRMQQTGQRQRQQQHGGRKAGEGHPPTSTLLVWNLPSFTTEQDIMKMFSDFTVVEVLIVKNHHIPKQLDGYVRFHRQEDAREAWQQEHRHYIINKRVTVRLCPEIDYEVAKNEYENPAADDNEPDTDARRCDSQVQEPPQMEPAGRGTGRGLFGSNFRQDSGDSGNRDGGSRVANPPSSFSTGQDAANSASNDNNSDQDSKFFNEPYLESTAPWLLDRSRSWAEDDDQQQQRGMRSGSQDHTASPGDGMVAPWNDPELRANLGDFREESRLSDASETRHNFRDNDSENAGGFPSPSQRDPRRRGAGGKNSSSSAVGGAGVGGPCNNSNDSSELFQRTTCLLLRNVDFSVTEEDVYDFFVQDGFRPRNVLLVRDENDRRTGECLVEFESPSEAAHAESKSSQNLGRRKVFASHLDRGQVADLMQRFDAIAKHNEGRGTKGSSSRWQDGPRGGAGGGGGGGGGGRRDARHDGGRESNGRTPDDDRRPSPPCAVGLLNLAYKTTVEDLQRFFRDFDLPLENIRRRFLDNGKPTGEAMIRFLSRHDAARAVDEYHNRSLFGRNVRMRLLNDD
ncbi:uncharacterized protein LOC128279053 [Anopheles cruzii]|uniref:uncharacterized protein LOC128279053 n=1 Tax=Anopheles cruzii TaxID=68878 RepID=UPI0022EC48A3|nr:uncharacterized protein LOC128279053 [Anopheles cruzii]